MEEHKKLSNACLAVDGSSLTPVILDLAEQLRKLGALTNLVVCHVHNHRKTYLPASMRLKSIQDAASEKFGISDSVTYDFRAQEHEKGVHQLLLTAHHTKKCDLLFIGFYGAKGERRRQEDLCSKIRKFVFESKLSLVVVKKQHMIREKPVLIFCYDGSDVAYEGLLDMLEVSQNIKAKLIVVHAESADTVKSTNIIRHQIRELKKISREIDLDLKVLEAKEWGPQRTLLQYLREEQSKVDFISLTKNGRRGTLTNKAFVGETAYAVLVGTDINLILLK